MRDLCGGLLLALAFVGCSSVKVQTDFAGVKVDEGLTPIEVVDVYNSSWLLFSTDWLPLGSGDPDNPDGWTAKLFRNTVTVESQLRMLENEARRVGARRAVNVTTVSSDESVFLFLLLREKYHTTGVLVK